MTLRLGKRGERLAGCFVWMRARVYRRLSSLVGEDAPEGAANRRPMGAQLWGRLGEEWGDGGRGKERHQRRRGARTRPGGKAKRAAGCVGLDCEN